MILTSAQGVWSGLTKSITAPAVQTLYTLLITLSPTPHSPQQIPIHTRLLTDAPTAHQTTTLRTLRCHSKKQYEDRIRLAVATRPTEKAARTLLSVVQYTDGLQPFTESAQATIVTHGLHIAVCSLTKDAAKQLRSSQVDVLGGQASLDNGVTLLQEAENLVLGALQGHDAVPIQLCQHSVADVLYGWSRSSEPNRALLFMASIFETQPNFRVTSVMTANMLHACALIGNEGVLSTVWMLLVQHRFPLTTPQPRVLVHALFKASVACDLRTWSDNKMGLATNGRYRRPHNQAVKYLISNLSKPPPNDSDSIPTRSQPFYRSSTDLYHKSPVWDPAMRLHSDKFGLTALMLQSMKELERPPASAHLPPAAASQLMCVAQSRADLLGLANSPLSCRRGVRIVTSPVDPGVDSVSRVPGNMVSAAVAITTARMFIRLGSLEDAVRVIVRTAGPSSQQLPQVSLDEAVAMLWGGLSDGETGQVLSAAMLPPSTDAVEATLDEALTQAQSVGSNDMHRLIRAMELASQVWNLPLSVHTQMRLQYYHTAQLCSNDTSTSPSTIATDLLAKGVHRTLGWNCFMTCLPVAGDGGSVIRDVVRSVTAGTEVGSSDVLDGSFWTAAAFALMRCSNVPFEARLKNIAWLLTVHAETSGPDVQEGITRAITSAFFRHPDCYIDIANLGLPRLTTVLLASGLPLSRHLQLKLARHEYVLATESRTRRMPWGRWSQYHAMLTRFTLDDPTFLGSAECSKLQKWMCSNRANATTLNMFLMSASIGYEIDTSVQDLCKHTVPLNMSAIYKVRRDGPAPQMQGTRAWRLNGVTAAVSRSLESSSNCLRMSSRVRGMGGEWVSGYELAMTWNAPSRAVREMPRAKLHSELQRSRILTRLGPNEAKDVEGGGGGAVLGGGRNFAKRSRIAARGLTHQELYDALQAVKRMSAVLAANAVNTDVD